MSETSREETAVTSGSRRLWWMGVGLLGVGATFFALLFGLVLPVFAPPLLQWSGYASLWMPVLVGVAIGPWLAVLGLFSAQRAPRERLLRGFQLILGCQLLLGGLVWLGWDVIRLQKVGWLAFLQIPAGKFSFCGVWGGPVVLGAGGSLLVLRSWRNHLGVTLATAGYTAAISLILYIVFYRLAPKLMVLFDPKALKMVLVGSTFGGVALVAGALGTFLMTPDVRLRLHLILLAPLWLPFFVVFFFWTLVVNTTLYFFEDMFDWNWHPSPLTKVLLLSWVSLVLFPLLLTVDFCIGLMRFLGQAAIDRVFPPTERLREKNALWVSPTSVYVVGAVLLLTTPLWLLPAAFFWSVRLFVYESIVQPLLGRKSTEE